MCNRTSINEVDWTNLKFGISATILACVFGLGRYYEYRANIVDRIQEPARIGTSTTAENQEVLPIPAVDLRNSTLPTRKNLRRD